MSYGARKYAIQRQACQRDHVLVLVRAFHELEEFSVLSIRDWVAVLGNTKCPRSAPE